MPGGVALCLPRINFDGMAPMASSVYSVRMRIKFIIPNRREIGQKN
jgi:hypothetical protein